MQGWCRAGFSLDKHSFKIAMRMWLVRSLSVGAVVFACWSLVFVLFDGLTTKALYSKFALCGSHAWICDLSFFYVPVYGTLGALALTTFAFVRILHRHARWLGLHWVWTVLVAIWSVLTVSDVGILILRGFSEDISQGDPIFEATGIPTSTLALAIFFSFVSVAKELTKDTTSVDIQVALLVAMVSAFFATATWTILSHQLMVLCAYTVCLFWIVLRQQVPRLEQLPTSRIRYPWRSDTWIWVCLLVVVVSNVFFSIFKHQGALLWLFLPLSLLFAAACWSLLECVDEESDDQRQVFGGRYIQDN